MATRRRQTQFQRAAEGQMSLMDHIRELRSRLFKASLAVVIGMAIGLVFAERVVEFLTSPYCDFAVAHSATKECTFGQSQMLESFMVNLKVALYIGLLMAAPVWLYQLWAFVAPGLHKRERRYTYAFVVVAAPLFALGVVLAFVVVERSLPFFLGLGTEYTSIVNIGGYFDFVTSMMLYFGIGFLFPLLVAALNMAGIVSAKRLLGWWRVAVFLMFVFAAIVTPTPDPFNMSILAICMSVLYFAAVGFAFLNDRRRGRNSMYGDLADDEISSIDDPTPVSPVDGQNWGRDRYDETP
ncbi:twin-arginine translocase subunit TatC [Luedemannella flava]|uniref:Sec-independent protein translocase protein TatC n=1 Tax=Luedemannella flava TaxID=349316 RepID=A0ABP4XWJ0_9ACTN